MENLEIIKMIIILIIFIIGTGLYGLSLFNNIKYGVPQVSTFKSDFKILRKDLVKYDLEGKNIADLGSGIGKTIRFFEKEFKMKSTGYEIDLSNVIIAKFINKIFKSKAKVIKGNYFEADLSKYDYIYLYLFPELIEKLEEKVWKDTKKGTIVFANAFNFKNKEPIDIFYKNGKKKIYIYKI